MKSPATLKEALRLAETHGAGVLEDFARADPNPNSASAQALEQIERRRRIAAIKLFPPKMPPLKPLTVGGLRNCAYRRLAMYCTVCRREWTVDLDRIPAAVDFKRLKDLQYPHRGCAALGAGMVRARPD